MDSNKTIIPRKVILWLLLGFSFLFFLYLIKSILLPFVIGILTAYLLDPAADKLEKIGFSRTLATIVITILFFVIIASGFALLLPVIFGQMLEFAAKIPGYYDKYLKEYSPFIKDFLAKINFNSEAVTDKNLIDKASSYFIDFSNSFLNNLWQSGKSILNIVSLILLTPVVTFYLLRDWDKITAKIDSYLPVKNAKTIRQQVQEIDQVLSGFIHGQLNVCIIVGIIYAIGLSLAGLDFGLLIGLGTGLLSFIPYAGFFAGFLVALLVAFFQFADSWHDIVWVVAAMLAGQALESNFITPKLVGDKVGLHPLWLIFGMLAGAALFGTVGVFIAVPLTAVIGVLIRFSLKEYKNSSLYKN